MFHQLSKIRLRLWDKFWYVSLCHCTFMQYRSNSFSNLNCLRMYNHVVSVSYERITNQSFNVRNHRPSGVCQCCNNKKNKQSISVAISVYSWGHPNTDLSHALTLEVFLLRCCVRFTPDCIGNVAIQDQIRTGISDSRRRPRPQENWSSSLKLAAKRWFTKSKC